MEDNYDNYTPLESRGTQKNLMRFGAISCTIIGIGLTFYYIQLVAKSHSLPKDGQVLNLTNFGAFGDFIGGIVGTIFSLAGIFFLYLTLKEQRENFTKERLENNFFEMIKFHRENVNELEFTYCENKKEEKVTAVKRKVFKVIYGQFKDLWSETNFLFENTNVNDIYLESFLKEVTGNDSFKCLKQLSQIDIVYLIVFFGLSKEDIITIKTICKNKYKEQFLENVISVAVLKPKKESDYWKEWNIINEIKDFGIKAHIIDSFYKKRNNRFILDPINDLFFNYQTVNVYYEDNYFKYYGGHQFRLGHYYRGIFQNINFINDQIYLKYEEKYSYVKLLRVHLSNYEQILLFLNSISSIGRKWEFDRKSNDINNRLITKYNLIKNIPSEKVIDVISIEDYYPLVNYESIKLDNQKQKSKIVKCYK
ncbi:MULTISPECIES: putative phage abortive infection protein [Flavobacterium]|uniref:putative phage abortive infection protein n=1 Tax=Flavobacterium TaxID=237 RepID=UPI0021145124|nr:MULTISPECIES: putative phage abortive infection protein [Flavobacterium]UUF15231.1 putative phage abortive infection protein [Flavobacterium panici]